jgi:hypothetical protein
MDLSFGNGILLSAAHDPYVNLSSARSVSPEHFRSFARAVSGNTALCMLNVSHNNLGSGVNELLNALMGHSRLRKLDLSHNDLSVDEARLVANLLQRNGVLESLRVGYNPLGDTGCIALAHAVRTHHNLTLLDISHTHITTVGMRSFVDVLQTNRILRVFNAACNVDITDESAADLSRVLCANDSLEELFIPSCSITDVGAFAFAECIKVNTALTRVTIFSDHISDHGQTALIRALEHNRTITVFFSGLFSSGLSREMVSTKDSVLKRNERSVHVRKGRCKMALLTLVGMRKLRRTDSGLLCDIPRDVLKLVGVRIVATNRRVEWEPQNKN